MKPVKLTAFLLLAALPACAQLQPQQAEIRPDAPPMTVLSEEDIAEMKRNETLPRPVNYDGQRWHYSTETEKASQEAARNHMWKVQDPALRAAVENKPVEWWGTQRPPAPAPRYWWGKKKPTPTVHVQVFDDGKGGVTTNPSEASAPPESAGSSGTTGNPMSLVGPCEGGNCPANK